MNERHVIGTAHFELTASAAGSQVASAGTAAEMVRTHLLPIAQTVFDDFSVGTEVVRLDRIDVDLGCLDSLELTEEMERRFEEGLRTALRSEGLLPVGEEQPWPRTAPEETADWDDLMHFLRTGRVLWSSPAPDAESMDERARRLIQAEPRSFASALGQARRVPGALDRFVSQMSDATLGEGLAALAATDAPRWRAILRRMAAAALGRGLKDTEWEGLRVRVVARMFDALLAGSGVDPEAALGPVFPVLSAPQARTLRDALAEQGPSSVDDPGRAPGSRTRPGGAQESEGSPVGEAASMDRQAFARSLEVAVRSGDVRTLADLVSGWSGGSSAGDVGAIARALADPDVARRVARRIPTPLLLDLVTLLHPPAAGDVADVVSGSRGFVAEGGWAAVFLSLAEATGGVFAPARFRHVLLTRLGIPDPAPGADADAAEAQPLLEPGDEQPRPDVRAVSDKSVERMLAADLTARDLPTMSGHLRRWAQERPDILERVLREHARDASLRRRLAAGLSFPALLDLVRVLERRAVGVVVELVRGQGRILPITPAPGHGEAFRQLLWGATLAHLVLDPPPFTPAGYLRSVVERLAVAGWIDREAGNAIADGEAVPTALMPALSIPALSAAAPAPDGLATGQRYELRDGLRRRLFGTPPAGSVPPDSVEGLLRELESAHPRLLLGLYREAQRRPADVARAAPGLRADELRSFVEAFLRLAGAGTSDELPRAISAFADRVSDRRGYYADVLQRVLENRLLDFEELGATYGRESRGAAPSGGDLHAEPAVAPPAGGEEPAPSRPEVKVPADVGAALEAALAVGGVALRRAIEAAFHHDPARLRGALEYAFARDASSTILVASLSDAWLERLLLLLRPGVPRGILDAADALATAGLYGTGPLHAQDVDTLKWRFLFRYLIGEERLARVDDFARAFFRHLVELAPAGTAATTAADIRAGLAVDLVPSMATGSRRILEALSEEDEAMEREGEAAFRPVAWELGEDMIISNAGLVLVAPFLPRLFEELQLTHERSFRDEAAAARAVHLLQYLVEGRSDRPEYVLVLNKLLCGLEEPTSLPLRVDLTEVEIETCHGLLEAVLGHWTALGNTSVLGLQESFFQRDGVLRRVDDAWQLDVENRAFDMLIDRIPWGFTTIHFPWMKHVLHVSWR